MADLNRQIKFFEENFQDLLERYEGAFVVISPSMEVNAFSTLLEGYQFGVRDYGLGNFLLRECRPDIVKEVHYITPNVVLA